MKDEHITGILESGPFGSLGEADLAAVRAHAAHCEACRRAYRAARVSSLLIRGRAAEQVEPPPFFQTRVMAALRERRAAGEATGFRGLWRATGALVSGMAATVAALAVFTFYGPAPAQDDYAFGVYSAEAVLLARGDQAGEGMSYDQVLATIYGTDEDAER